MKTILIVDDESIILNVSEMYFNSLGYKAILAINGQDALNKFDTSIDAVILDVMMPVMNGIECYHEIRKIHNTVPIVMCSGHGAQSLGSDVFNDKNFRFMNKPIRYDEMSKTIIGMIFLEATTLDKGANRWKS